MNLQIDPELAQALVRVQAALRNLQKSAANPFFKSKYVPLDTVLDEIRPLLAQEHLAVLQSSTLNGEQLELLTTFVHKNGHTVSTTVACGLTKRDPQGSGSAITYLRRYALCAALGIAGTDDDDANAAVTPPAPKKPFGVPPAKVGSPLPTVTNAQL